MSEERQDEVPAATAAEEVERRAIDAALNFLSYRQRSGQEVRKKLASRGFSEPTIEAAMRRLQAVRLVDDEAYVTAYVRDRIAHRPMGIRRMVQELYLKGIPRQTAVPVIEEVFRDEDTDERALAERVLEKKRRTLSQVGDEVATRRRLRDHLIRRGFGGRVLRDVLDDLFANDDAVESE